MKVIKRPKKSKFNFTFGPEDLTHQNIEVEERSFDVLKQQVDFIYKMIYEYQDREGKYPDYIVMDELDFIFITQYLMEERKFGISAYDYRKATLFGCKVVKAKVPYPICGKI